MKAIAFVDIQGFKTDDNNFILKEIAIAHNDQVQVLLLKPPFPFYNLTYTERKQVKWIERNRKINWNDGFIPYDNFLVHIDEFLTDKIIYCKGVEKVTWLSHFLDRGDIINIEDLRCPSLLSLYEKYRLSNDIFNCIYHPTICALRNVTCLKKWCTENKIID